MKIGLAWVLLLLIKSLWRSNHAWVSSLPVLHPESTSDFHLLSTWPCPSPITPTNCWQTPSAPTKWGSACSRPPTNAAGLSSTWLLTPKPPIFTGCLRTQFWNERVSRPSMGTCNGQSQPRPSACIGMCLPISFSITVRRSLSILVAAFLTIVGYTNVSQ